MELTYDGLIEIEYATPRELRGVWLVGRKARKDVYKVKDLNGRPAFAPGYPKRYRSCTLLGRPVCFVEGDRVTLVPKQ